MYPSISQDYSHIGFDAEWEPAEDADRHRNTACILAIIFAFSSSMLLVSIIRTIITNPGNIPEEKEWDMNTDSQADGESAPENLP